MSLNINHYSQGHISYTYMYSVHLNNLDTCKANVCIFIKKKQTIHALLHKANVCIKSKWEVEFNMRRYGVKDGTIHSHDSLKPCDSHTTQVH